MSSNMSKELTDHLSLMNKLYDKTLIVFTNEEQDSKFRKMLKENKINITILTQYELTEEIVEKAIKVIESVFSIVYFVMNDKWYSIRFD